MEGRRIIEGQPGPRQPAHVPGKMPQAPRGPERGNITQIFALVVGLVYLVVGLVGFAATGFTGITTNGGDALIGFDLNIFHNVVHIAIGLGFIIASQVDASITQGIVIGGGLVYVLAALLGFLNELQILSIDDEWAPDNFLHLFSGAAAVAFGLIGIRQSASRSGGQTGARMARA